MHKEELLKDYHTALAEGQMDVAYSRVMFLGTAGVGKTSLKRALMKKRWDPSSINSTIVSDVHSVRPVGYQWQKLGQGDGDQWSEVTEEDEIQEMAELLAAVHTNSGVEQFKSKLNATELFHIDETDYDDRNVSRVAVEEIEKTHVQSLLSEAVNRAKLIAPGSNITPQPLVNLWDCGGQPVFLEILPAFLTSRTMFFLIYDASKSFHDRWKSVQTIRGEKKEEEEVNMTTLDLIHSWLSNIHIHLGKSDDEGALLDYPQVLCIGTHGDKIKDHGSKINELESCLKGKPFEVLIDGFYIVNNTTAGKSKKEDPNFSIIRSKISEFTSNKLIIKTPISWVLFRKVLGFYKANVISFKETCAIGLACKIPTEVVSKVLLFYHSLGVLLFYPHIKGLQDKVIINPKWFTLALGKVLTLQGREEHKTRLMWDLLREKGILVQPLYVAAWREIKDISPEAIIELLVHFRLAAKVSTDEYYDPNVKQYFLPLVLPSCVSQEPLSGYLQRATPLHLTFRTGYVPPGFFTRLVTILAESPRCEIRFNKGVYRDKIHISYGDPPCDAVILSESIHAIQVEIFRYCPENESFSKFTNICQMLSEDLLKMSKAVDHCLFGNSNKKYKSEVFKQIRFLCARCPSAGLHYLNHKESLCSDSYFNCEVNEKYRQLSIEEGLWFPKTPKNKELSKYLSDYEMLKVSERIQSPQMLSTLAALLNMTSNLKRIQADDSNRGQVGFELLYEWTQADGIRNELVQVLNELKLNHLAQMVQQGEYDTEKFKRTAPTSKSKLLYDVSTPSLISSSNDHMTFQSGVFLPTMELEEISDNDVLRCSKYIEENKILKLVHALDDPSLNLSSIVTSEEDTQIKVYHVMKQWLQAHPNTSRVALQEKLKLLGFHKAAKSLSSTSDTKCVVN